MKMLRFRRDVFWWFVEFFVLKWSVRPRVRDFFWCLFILFTCLWSELSAQYTFCILLGKPSVLSSVWTYMADVSVSREIYRMAQKFTPLLYALTLPNINRFSKLFHCKNQDKICNKLNTITKDLTTPQMCRCVYSSIQLFSCKTV